MHKKLSMIIAALAVSAAFVGASSASAATLYTSAAHTTPVAVNSTFTATTPAPETYNVFWYVGGSLFQSCKTATYSFKVTQNSAGVFKANVTASSYSAGCLGTLGNPIGNASGTLQVSGSSVANGSNTAWLGSTLNGVSWQQPSPISATYVGNYSSATGSPPTKGVFTQQPTAAKAPVSVILNHAEKWSGEAASGDFSATYTLTGPAASWSFG